MPKKKKRSAKGKGSPTATSARADSDSDHDGTGMGAAKDGRPEAEVVSPRVAGSRRPSKKLLEGCAGLVMDEARWRKKQGISDATKV